MMMRSKSIRIVAAMIVSAACLVMGGFGSTIAVRDAGPDLVGNWIGESICVGNRPACHDEQVIYRITKAPDTAGKVTITAHKIVNGKPELMGVLDFKYDSEKQTLVCDFTPGNTSGLWELTVNGNTMEGTLTVLPDKTLVRRVKVKKDAANQPAHV
jgi:hypothetical protein